MKYQVLDVSKETADSVAITFDGKLDFHPGQFVMLEFATEDSEKPVKRAYSIGSSPLRNLKLYVKEKRDGFVSKHLQNCNVGCDYELTGPFGHFQFNPEMHEQIVLIGAGSGVAPLISMVEYVNDRRLGTKVWAFISNKIEKDIIGRKALEKESAANKNIEVYFNLTRDNDNKDWHDKKGRIDRKYLESIIKDFSGKFYFLCGPLDFVKSMKEILIDRGVNLVNIKQEAFG